jgi:RNA-directed DNA polymerase
VHPAATAYVKGRSIGENARRHSKNDVILKLDFEDFFPSIRVRDWTTYIQKYAPEWTNDGAILTRILFWGQGQPRPKCLSIGAPTSPLISNLVMYELDQIISREADEKALVYTRYADDITVSGSSIDSIIAFERFIRAAVKQSATPKLKINEKKRGVYTKGQRRMVTGLIITPEARVSIGRERKRQISALLHKFSLGLLDTERTGYLKGMMGFAIANEPDFVTRMRRKYGHGLIEAVLRVEIRGNG